MKTPIARTPLEPDEMVAILEEIARTGHATARIQAIRTLLSLEERQRSAGPTSFDKLDELMAKRDGRNGRPAA